MNRPSFAAANQAATLTRATNERVVQLGRLVAGHFSSCAVDKPDDKLFANVTYNNPYMSYILPGTTDTKYHLTPRPHNFMLTAKKI